MSGLFDSPIKIKKPNIKAVMPMVKKPSATTDFMKMATDKAKMAIALNNAKKTGKPFMVKTPSGVKKFTPKATPFNIAPTANRIKANSMKKTMPMQTIKPVQNEVRNFEQSLQKLNPAKEAQAIFNLPPTPKIVSQLNPIQRSFLKTDLPYRVLSSNNYGQPSIQKIQNTPLKFSIDIDQIQPAVDSGISNYYGK